ncbi:hypothetical protein HYALB_00005087 [Hymenoscyphus albidus]|uniref:Calcineurin-like phosphoesterase domain-containing protein n=1 Tax=Hymenoscyphus albidus TaxID=595503 RepID=A0A9N9Q924_9HELO|nr:hypothetical protein HYALB_00005087 [Hymenoscyphus albidus]
MRQFQIISDLYLETPKSYDVFEVTPSAPYLALIGDIGNAKDPEFFDFITKQLSLFKIEVKESPTSETLGSFVFLDQTRFDLSDDTTILGCTLYSNITPEQSEHVSFGLNDFYHIEDWTVEDHCKAHAADLRWLNDQVNSISKNESNRKVIVLTHHGPTISPCSSDPAHSGSRISSGFMTDLSNEICWTSRNVKVLAFGHTHYNCDYVDDGKRVVANQRGYYFKPAEGFDEKKVVEV